MMNHSSLRILHLQLELDSWPAARPWTYGVGLGTEEGLTASGVEFLTIPLTWLPRALEIVGDQRFDQVWVEAVHQAKLPDAFFEWFAGLAPVRIGFYGESLTTDPRDAELWPEVWPAMQERHAVVTARLPYLTHVVAVDEQDVLAIDSLKDHRAMWWPQAVPSRFVLGEAPATQAPALFAGTPYGKRKALLEHPAVSRHMQRLSSPEDNTMIPALFDRIQAASQAFFSTTPRSEGPRSYPAYLASLRNLRRTAYRVFLEGLRAGSAVVNLPHVVKGYAGRVTEGIAAGRPIVSWDLPNRPRNRALFEPGKEILLYNAEQPLELAEHLERVRTDSTFAAEIARNARAKLLAHHTVEHRVKQILDWSVDGIAPVYA